MILADEAATMAAGERLAKLLQPGDIIAMTGDLGAGKTTLVRGLLRALGHTGEVPSPSFAIVQPYEDIDPPVWHADLYRVDDRNRRLVRRARRAEQYAASFVGVGDGVTQ